MNKASRKMGYILKPIITLNVSSICKTDEVKRQVKHTVRAVYKNFCILLPDMAITNVKLFQTVTLNSSYGAME